MNANPSAPSASSPVGGGSQPSTPISRPHGPDDAPTGARGFFTGTGLPLFLLSAAVVYETFLLAVVFAPESTSAWGGFAREFKQWCFRYDPRSGGMEWAAVWVMLVEPAFVVLVAWFLWRRGLRTLRSFAGWRRHARFAIAGAMTAGVAMAALFIYGQPGANAGAPLPFPGERIRTHLAVPAFPFVDQRGGSFSLEQLRGRVVLVTGIYAMCSTSCPEILQETRTVLASLAPDVRGRVSVVALSLNPEEDGPDLMLRLSEGHGFQYPEFRYLNGPPPEMYELLARLGFSRVKNSRTSIIEHANLFLVLDGRGEIAYRFTLDPRHRSWLREALNALAGETAAL